MSLLLAALLALSSAGADPCPSKTPRGRWQRLPPAPAESKAQAGAHGKHRADSWWADGELHLLRGTKHAVLDVCARRWSMAAPIPLHQKKPAGASTERRMDAVAGRGPELPYLGGERVAVDGGELTPKPYAPRPYFLMHQFAGAALTVDGRRLVLPEAGAPSPRRPGTYAIARAKGRLLIHGGQAEDGWTDELHVLHLGKTPRWEKLPSSGLARQLIYYATSLQRGRFVLWGADFGRVFDLKTRRWSEMSFEDGPVFGPRNGWPNYAVVGLAGKLAAVRRDGAPGGRLERGAIYDVLTNRWTPLEGFGGNRAWRLDEHRALLAEQLRGRAHIAILDVKTAKLTPLEPPNGDHEQLAVHYSGARLFVVGGNKKTMTDPGGGCDNHVGPQGCDPVPPSYRTEQSLDGWVYRP